MNFKVVLEPSDEGGYTAIVPSLPGCISEGGTKDEALKNQKGQVSIFNIFHDLSCQVLRRNPYLIA